MIETTNEDYKKEFSAKIPEHVHYVAGFLEALSWLTLRCGYKHLFWVRLLNWQRSNRIKYISQELGYSVSELVDFPRFIGEIEQSIKRLTTKDFKRGESIVLTQNELNAIEDLVWHAAEYIDWFKEFSYSCHVEKGSILLETEDKGSIYCFSINEKYIVVIGITERTIPV